MCREQFPLKGKMRLDQDFREGSLAGRRLFITGMPGSFPFLVRSAEDTCQEVLLGQGDRGPGV